MRMNMLRKAAHFNGLSGAAGWMKAFWLAFVSASFAVSMVSCGGSDDEEKCPAEDKEWNEEQEQCVQKQTTSSNNEEATPEEDEFDVTYDPEGTFTFAGLDLSDVKAELTAGKDIEVTIQDTGEWEQVRSQYKHEDGVPVPKEPVVLTATVLAKEDSTTKKDMLVLSFDKNPKQDAEKLAKALTYLGGETVNNNDFTPPIASGDDVPNGGKTPAFDTENAKLSLEWSSNATEKEPVVVWNGEALGYLMSTFSVLKTHDLVDADWENPFEGDGDKDKLEGAVKKLVDKFKTTGS